MAFAVPSCSHLSSRLPLEKREIYYKLRSVFPNTDPSYIQNILINTPEGVRDHGGIEILTNDLVEHLILDGDDHIDMNAISISKNYWEEIVPSSPEAQCERLIGIFPDADPDFIREFATKYYNNSQKINVFVDQNLNQKNYPTREEYVARRKRAEEYLKYFTEFDIKTFLNEYPDPFAYFEGETTYTEEKKVFSLLCSWFPTTKPITIMNVYRNENFNPSLTVKRLEQGGGVIKPEWNEFLKDLDKSMPDFAFICNRQKIQQYLDKITKEEAEDLKKSKERNELLHCESCFNDFIAAKCSTCDNGHVFCNTCISFGTECKIAEAKYTISCFQDCKSVFGLQTLKNILTPKIYAILLKKQQEEELAAANIGILENCPFCDFKSVVNEGDKVLSCMHDDCKKQSCRKCKKANHLPNECSDVFEEKNLRLFVEEKLTSALVRTCYSCKKEFVKLEGCNRMECSSCGAVMCYLCDKAVSPNNYKHFNAQGGNYFDLCPLFSDDSRQEAQAVIEVANTIKRDLLKRNPDLDLEIVDKLLPELPPKTEGAHDHIINSHQIPERAIRIAKAISP